ncbi:MAG: DUF554 domain-containing protein [Treponema sp.]|jgi:uncharacterized membrane protein YqgA involved in biofilm formation|nr:DUF554 domain-containing protein [Treponema sp.]
MPIGAIANSALLALGGLFGILLGRRLSEEFKNTLTLVMGLCALMIAITNIIKLHSLTPVALSLILGVIIGEALLLDTRVKKAVGSLFGKAAKKTDSGWTTEFCFVATLFVASGTGIFGILKEGFEAEPSILLTKAALDFFAAMIFAAKLGGAVSFIAIPQFSVYIVLFLFSRWIFPLLTERQIMNFYAVGGLVDLAIGLSMLNVHKFRTINFLPAFVVVFPVTLLFDLF